jgi:hypothetical protein
MAEPASISGHIDSNVEGHLNIRTPFCLSELLTPTYQELSSLGRIPLD